MLQYYKYGNYMLIDKFTFDKRGDNLFKKIPLVAYGIVKTYQKPAYLYAGAQELVFKY